jgi:GntR family transcriptional repressor for pyruvate dehydrogenase complex
VLEPLGAQLAAHAAREDDLQALAANLARMDMLAQKAAEDDAQVQAQRQSALIELDVQFHALVARAGRNRALMLAREPVSLLYSATLARMQAQLPQMHARNLVAHRHIVEALRQHDADRAEHWMRKHIVDFQRGFVLAQLDMHVPVSMAE